MPKLTPDGPSIYKDCGKKRAYDRHRADGTQPCRKCKDAIAKAVRDWRHRNGRNKSRLVPDHIIKQHGIKVNK